MGSVSPGLPEIPQITTAWSATIKAGNEVPYTSDLDIYQHCPAELTSLKVLPGPEWSLLNQAEQAQLLETTFTVGQESNRQGLRLDWPAEMPAYELPTLISSPVIPGTVQLTNNGPIVLMKDAHTIGGFPRILVASIDDIAPLAQLKPGDKVGFVLG